MKNKTWRGPSESYPLMIRVLMGLSPDLVRQYPEIVPLLEQWVFHPTNTLQTELQKILHAYTSSGGTLCDEHFWSVVTGVQRIREQQNITSLKELDDYFMEQKRAFGYFWRVARLRPGLTRESSAEQDLTESLQGTCN